MNHFGNIGRITWYCPELNAALMTRQKMKNASAKLQRKNVSKGNGKDFVTRNWSHKVLLQYSLSPYLEILCRM